MKNILFVIAVISTMTACNEIDKKNKEEWQYVSIGQNKQAVIHLMGQPFSENSINVLGVELDRLEWKSDLHSRTYQVDMAFNKVVSKQNSN